MTVYYYSFRNNIINLETRGRLIKISACIANITSFLLLKMHNATQISDVSFYTRYL